MSKDLISVRGAAIRNDVTVIGYDKDSLQPVVIGDEESTSHLHVIGKTGKGKSTLLINRFVGDIRRGQGGAFISPDVGAIKRILERIPTQRMKDVVYLDPGDRAFPFGLNLLYCDDISDQAAVEKGAERLLHVMKRIWGPGSKDPSWGPQLEDVLSNAIYALMFHQLTLADMSKLLKNKEFRQQIVSALPDNKIPWLYIREAWESFEELPVRLQEERTYSTYNKIMAFLRKPTIVHIIGQEETTIDFRAILQNQKILLVRLAEDDIGEEGTRLLGTMLVAQMLDAVLARERLPEEEWYYFSLVCDEFQEFASEDFHKMLTRVRKYKVKVTIAHQFMKQLDELNRGAVDNTGNKVSFQLTTEDAPYYAPIFANDPPPGEMIYERIMRRQEKRGISRYWNPPEAKEQLLEALLALEKVRVEQFSLAKKFGLSLRGKCQKLAGWKTIPAYTHYEAVLPVHMLPAKVDQQPRLLPAHLQQEHLPSVSHDDPPEWEVMRFVYAQSLIPQSPLWNAIVEQYKNGDYSRFLDLVWDLGPDAGSGKYKPGNSKTIDYFYNHFYVPTKLPDLKLTGSGWNHPTYRTKERLVYEDGYWMIAPHVQPGIAYPLPSHFLLRIETGWESYSEPVSRPPRFSGVQNTWEEIWHPIHQALGREVCNLIGPYKQGMYMFFDPDGYEEWGGKLTAERAAELRRHGYRGGTFRFVNAASHYHWSEPFLPYEQQLWQALLTWIQKKVSTIDRKKKHFVDKIFALADCYREEEIIVDLGSYQPVRITEWEYRNVGGFMYGHDDLIETDHEIYQARQGPSPYSVKDMRDRTEQELLRLPNYTAHCQIINLQAESDEKAVVRCKLGTYPLDPSIAQTDEAYREREDFVRLQTRRLYCRPQKEVEEKIIKRRTEWTPEVEQPAAKQETPGKQKSPVQKPQGGVQVCLTCGAENTRDDVLCVNCQLPLIVEGSAMPSSIEDGATTQETQQPKQRKSRRG